MDELWDQHFLCEVPTLCWRWHISHVRTKQEPFPSFAIKALPLLNFPESPDDPGVDQESEDDLSASRTSLERQAPHRGNTTVHVCWHRNTSVSMVDFSVAVEVFFPKPYPHLCLWLYMCMSVFSVVVYLVSSPFIFGVWCINLYFSSITF